LSIKEGIKSLIIDNILDGVYLLDSKGRFTFVNDVIVKRSGYPKEWFLGKSYLEVIRPEDMEHVKNNFEAKMRGEDVPPYELAYHKTDGSLMHVEINTTRILYKDRNISSLIGFSRDITARKQVEGELRKSEDKYRTLIETTGTGFVIIDKDGLVLDANPEYVRLTGHHDLSEIVGRSVIEWTSDSEKGKNTAAIKAALEKGYIRNLEIDYVGSKGIITPIEINATSMEIEGKIQTITICRDITERRRTEEALQDSRHRYKSLIESANEGILVAQNSMLRFVNPAFTKIIGYSELELTAKPFIDFIHPEDRDMVLENHIRRMMGEKFPSKYEFKIVTREGVTKDAELDSVMIQWGGKPAALGFINDITARKQAEDALRTSLQEKEILLSEVHHRVKNNMQVMSGLLDLQASSTGNPELTEMLNESQRRIQSMALIHEKLYDSKDFTRIDLAGYVRTLSQELFQAYKINPGKIDLIIQTDSAVYVDISKAIPCGLILNELISNALKHAFPGDTPGKLEIIIRETKNTEIDSQTQAPAIEIVVRDNGLGIPDDVDIHKPQTMGLHLVNGLVEKQLDGQIEVIRDAGTEFRIKFPLLFVENKGVV
jgi:PAS domain S-box-containing protein